MSSAMTAGCGPRAVESKGVGQRSIDLTSSPEAVGARLLDCAKVDRSSHKAA